MYLSNKKKILISLGFIFLILGSFGYLVWEENRVNVVEKTNETIITETLSQDNENEEIDALESVESDLPEYSFDTVDTIGWEYREIKIDNVGIRYRVPANRFRGSLNDVDTYESLSLSKYGLSDFFMVGIEQNEILHQGYDLISITPCIECEPPALSSLNMHFVESTTLTLQDIESLILQETCEYSIQQLEESEITYFRYQVETQCNQLDQVKGFSWETSSRRLQPLDDLISLRFSSQNIMLFQNPFVFHASEPSNLIQYPVVSPYGVDETTMELKYDNQLLFVTDVGDNFFLIITYTHPTTYDEFELKKINNLMFTILSTIEVL